LIRETIISIALFLTASQIGAGQAEAPKQAGVHSQYGIDIIPDPQVVHIAGADFVMNSATVVSADPQLQDLSPVVSLQEGLAETLQLHISKAGSQPLSNVIVLKLVPEGVLREVPDGSARREAYALEVSGSRISIEAPYPAGLFYGVQTLLQLAEQGRGNVRGLKIVDWPDMEFRAVHVDLWYHLDRPWYYEYLFRQLARYKINAAVFEFEDKFPYSRHPLLTAPGAMTRDQVRHLVETGKRYHIEIVPLVQTLGHVAFIAKHPEFYELREVPMSNWQLCPLKKGTFPLIQEMLDEVLEVVQPAKYFHIGGDEARELVMGAECREKWGDKAAV
jgi:N-acetyl-beta-hexosaminidase